MAVQNETQAEIRALRQMLFQQRAQSDAIQNRIDELERASQTDTSSLRGPRSKATGRGRARKPPVVYRYDDDDDDDDEDEIPRPVQVKLEQAAKAAAKHDNINSQAGQKRKRAATDLDVSDLNVSLPAVDAGADNNDDDKEAISHRVNVKALKANNNNRRRRPPFPFKPLPQKPLPTPEHATPKPPPASRFQQPTIPFNSASIPQQQQQQDATLSRPSTASSSTDEIAKSIQAKLQRMSDGLSERESTHATSANFLRTIFKFSKPRATERAVAPEPEEETDHSGHEEVGGAGTAHHHRVKSKNASSTTDGGAPEPPSPHNSDDGEKRKKKPKPKFKTAAKTKKPPELTFHHSKDLEENMSDFWNCLSELIITWESQAGTFWKWEVERRRRGATRVCVSRALAKKRTKWRVGDDGFFACNDCAVSALPCFTWVCHDEEDGDESGEFWCLPVHGGDRYLPLVEGKEIRRWINEGRECDGDEDDGGSEFGVGGFGDNGAFVPSESEDEDEGESESEDDDDGVCDEEE